MVIPYLGCIPYEQNGSKPVETGMVLLELVQKKHLFAIAKCFATLCTNEYNPDVSQILEVKQTKQDKNKNIDCDKVSSFLAGGSYVD